MKNIAHRCFAGLYPENTLAAIEQSTSGEKHERPDTLEIDVQPSQDGEIIVFHDEDLNKHGERGLTDKAGMPWKMDIDDIQEAKILRTDERIPTLKQFLEATPNDVAVNIELKDVDSEEVQFEWGTDDIELGIALDEDQIDHRKKIWYDFAEQVLETASEFENDILISSFFEGAIAAVREIDENVPVAFLFFNSIEEGLEVTRRYDCESVHPPLDMIKSDFFNSKTYTDSEFEEIDLVEEMHSEGRNVNVWNIENWYQADQMRKAGVDGMISDYPNDLWFRS